MAAARKASQSRRAKAGWQLRRRQSFVAAGRLAEGKVVRQSPKAGPMVALIVLLMPRKFTVLLLRGAILQLK